MLRNKPLRPLTFPARISYDINQNKTTLEQLVIDKNVVLIDIDNVDCTIHIAGGLQVTGTLTLRPRCFSNN